MDLLNLDNAQNIFISAVQQQNQLEGLANSALSRGIDLYMNKDYEGAIKEFRRSIGLSPHSAFSVDAAHHMANAYLAIDDTEGAIKSYQTALQLDLTRADTHIELGNLYFTEERYEEAMVEYKEAVTISSNSSNTYALGQAYMQLGRYAEAQDQFTKILRLEPDKPGGNYGLGLNYGRQGRYEEAISQFKQAIKLQNDFYDAYAELGYAYADSGQVDRAQKQIDFLEQNAPELADTLSSYLYETEPPKFTLAYANSTFKYYLPIKTPVSALDAYLENANAFKSFNLKFQFNKEMDRESVQNVLNWQIHRASATGPGQAYNFGLPVPTTEIEIPLFPEFVYYDSEALTATVTFTIRQNASADGTIDPSHIEFKFSGKDDYGNGMSPDHDQFSGFATIA
jgi:tetratricopeptide (TPR) repeat protein